MSYSTGNYVKTAYAGATSSGGSGTPGGANTQVQFNDAGSFGGDAGLTYNKTSDRLNFTKTASGEYLRFTDGTDTFGFFNRAGTPEGNIAANTASLSLDSANGDLYIKQTDTVNTDWEQFETYGGAQTLTTTATLTTNKRYFCSASGGAFTVTLPAAATHDGKVVEIKKIDSSANAVTIDGNGAELIDGSASYGLASENDSVLLACDGTGWKIMASKGGGGDVSQNGNSFGATMVVGTNDAFDLQFERGGSSIAQIQAAGFNPVTDNTKDLGTTALRWKTLHVGPASLVVHNDATNTDKVTIGYSGADASIDLTATTNLAVAPSQTTGTLAIGGTAATGTISLGTSTDAQQVDIAQGLAAKTVNIANTAGGGLRTVNIANPTGGISAVSIGNNNGASSMSLLTGTGHFSLDGSGSTNYSIGVTNTTTGNITIGGLNQTGNITLGSSAAASNLRLANGAGSCNVFVSNNNTTAATGNFFNTVVGNTINMLNGANTAAQAFNLSSGNGSANRDINIGAGTPTAGTTTINLGHTAAGVNSYVKLNGAYTRDVQTISTSQTLAERSSVVLCTATLTATLPTGVTGQIIDIVNNGSGTTVTVSGTIDAGTDFATSSFTLSSAASQTLVCTSASNWKRI